MAVKFKNKPGSGDTSKTFDHLHSVVRDTLKLPLSTQIRVGVTETTISDHGVRAVLPFGVAHIKKGSDSLKNSLAALQTLAGSHASLPHVNTPSGPQSASGAAPAPSYDDMTDQQWVEHVAGELFPGTVHLYQTHDLYQPVVGTSGGSIYKTCFIGPDLKIAARIKGSKVSFRATTSANGCPDGAIKSTLKRLGVSSEYDDRMTGHADMGGPYDEAHAHEYRALFGAMYAALKPWIVTNFPAIGKLTEGVK